MELRNFRRGRHLYSAGWPSSRASAHILVMAALWNRQAIIFLPCGFFYLLLHLWSPYVIGQAIYIYSCCGFVFFFFPRLISAVGDWMPSQIGRIPYFHRWCGLSANLRCRSETCCMRLAANTGRKISAKICHLGAIAQLCRAISSQLRHISTIGKSVKQQYLPHMSLQYGALRPTSG